MMKVVMPHSPPNMVKLSAAVAHTRHKGLDIVG